MKERELREKAEGKINSLVARIYGAIKEGDKEKILKTRNELRNEFYYINLLKEKM